MKSDDVLAVVVSFNGGYKTLQTVEALLGRVGHVHIVDNGSAPESLKLLRPLEGREGLSLRLWEDNRGVGAALNSGVAIAKEKSYGWLLTMDQDSIIDGRMIEEFSKTVRLDPSLACLAPTVILGTRDVSSNTKAVKYAITSGNLVRLDLFDKVGLFDENFFIDCIDFDFSLRVRAAGFSIMQVGTAFLHHELGDTPTPAGFLTRFHTYHSPLRRYYIYRNYLYMVKKHLRSYPYFMLKMTVAHALQLITILFLGKKRMQSFLYIGYGVRDYLRGISGAYPDGL